MGDKEILFTPHTLPIYLNILLSDIIGTEDTEHLIPVDWRTDMRGYLLHKGVIVAVGEDIHPLALTEVVGYPHPVGHQHRRVQRSGLPHGAQRQQRGEMPLCVCCLCACPAVLPGERDDEHRQRHPVHLLHHFGLPAACGPWLIHRYRPFAYAAGST